MKILIQKRLLADLEVAIYNSRKLDLDFAVYLVSLLNSLPTQNRNEIEKLQPEVQIDSQRVKKINWEYSTYKNFLIEQEFIEQTKGHYAEIGRCASYRIEPSYYQDDLVEFSTRNRKLLEKFDSKGSDIERQKRMEYCSQTRPHLVSFFDNNLRMVCDAAEKEIQQFRHERYEKYRHGMQILLEWKYQSWSYSISSHSDNRLHSLLTRTNSDFRKYITYKGEPLVFLDLKTSQPYFFCALLTGLCLQDMEYLKRIGATKNINEDFLCNLFNVIDRDEAREFVWSVIDEDSDYYEGLAEIIPIQHNERGNPIWTKKSQSAGYKEVIQEFDSPRECMKLFNMLLFNCKSGHSTKEIKAFANYYPTVFEVLTVIKKEMERKQKNKKAKGDAYKVLCHIEAHCLLDIAAKEIAKRYPQIPIFSIHDCLVTTKKHSTRLYTKMDILLHELTLLKPKIEIESYSH